MFSGFASALQLTYLLGSLTIQSYICQPPTAPTIIEPIDGSSVVVGVPFTVTGNGPEESTIVISADGTDVVSVQADATQQYSANITLSSEGSHTISTQATRSCGSTQGSTITVEAIQSEVPPVDPVEPGTPSPETPGVPSTNGDEEQLSPDTGMPPAVTPKPDTTSDDQGTSKGLSLSVKTPTNFSTTTDESVFVTGTTSKSATVSISVNGDLAGSTLTAQTTYGLGIPLKLGENTIRVTATASDGTTASVTLNVTRQQASANVSWASSESGQATIRVVAIAAISILLILAIIGICLP